MQLIVIMGLILWLSYQANVSDYYTIAYRDSRNDMFPIFQVGLQKQRRLLQTENLTLEAVITMKSQRLSFVADENRRLKELLRARETISFLTVDGVF